MPIRPRLPAHLSSPNTDWDTWRCAVPAFTVSNRRFWNLNDPFVVSEAEVCARRVLTLSQQSVDARVNQVFRTILSRNATFAEQERFRGLALEVASLHQIRKEDIPDSVIVWKDVAHSVFNLKEFIYVQ